MAEYKSDIEIAQAAEMLPISEVAAKVGLTEDQLDHYGSTRRRSTSTRSRTCRAAPSSCS